MTLFVVSAPSVGEQQTSNWVSISVSSMRVELSTSITSWDVDLCEVTNSGELDEGVGLDELSGGEGTLESE